MLHSIKFQNHVTLVFYFILGLLTFSFRNIKSIVKWFGLILETVKVDEYSLEIYISLHSESFIVYAMEFWNSILEELMHQRRWQISWMNKKRKKEINSKWHQTNQVLINWLDLLHAWLPFFIEHGNESLVKKILLNKTTELRQLTLSWWQSIFDLHSDVCAFNFSLPKFSASTILKQTKYRMKNDSLKNIQETIEKKKLSTELISRLNKKKNEKLTNSKC